MLGEALRYRRESRGRRQDDVAAVARSWGFDWTQATVAAYEMGRRDFSIEEFHVLGYIAADLTPLAATSAAARADAQPVELADLLPSAGEQVRLSGRLAVDASSLRPILRGEARGFTLPIVTAPATGFRGDFDATTEAENVAVLDCLWPGERARDRGEGGAIRDLFAAAHAERLGDAEQKAARRLRTPTLAVAAAARKRWGRSLTEERDRQLAAASAGGSSPRTLQALRGHITRGLVDELRQEGIEGLKVKRISAQRAKAIQAGWQRATARARRQP